MDNLVHFPKKVDLISAVEATLPQVGGNKFIAVCLVMASLTEEIEKDENNEYTAEDIGLGWLGLYEHFLKKKE